jgi:transposase-like protein
MGDVASIGKEALRSAHTSASELSGEVLSGPERRRCWSADEQLRLLAQRVAPGSSPTLACRMYRISTGQLSTWRKQFRTGDLTGFVPVSFIAAGTACAACCGCTRTGIGRHDRDRVAERRQAAHQLRDRAEARSVGALVIGILGNVRIYLACGVTDTDTM